MFEMYHWLSGLLKFKIVYLLLSQLIMDAMKPSRSATMKSWAKASLIFCPINLIHEEMGDFLLHGNMVQFSKKKAVPS